MSESRNSKKSTGFKRSRDKFNKNNKNKNNDDRPFKRKKYDDKKNVSLDDLSKRQKKQVKRTHFQILAQSKTYWERIRDEQNTSNEERKNLITELLKLLDGQLLNLILKHDGSRIVQSCVKFGTPIHKKKICIELKGKWLSLAKQQYSRFLVLSMIKNASTNEIREILFHEFSGNVLNLLKHQEASDIIEHLYKIGDDIQKTRFVEELYGNEFVLFKTSEVRDLKTVLKQYADKKQNIMSTLSRNLNILITKKLVYQTIIHHALSEYYKNAGDNDKVTISKALSSEVIHLIRSKRGSYCAAQCVSYSTAKERKKIIKGVQEEGYLMSMEEYGHIFIVRLLDVTDDTVLINKFIVKHLIDHIDDVIFDKHGRLSILHILTPKSKKYFPDYDLELLEPCFVRNTVSGESYRTSKKEDSKRREELLNKVSQPLLDYCKENLNNLLRDVYASSVVEEVINHAIGDKTPILDELIELCSLDDDNDYDNTNNKHKNKNDDKKKNKNKNNNNEDMEDEEKIENEEENEEEEEEEEEEDKEHLLTHRIANRVIKRLITENYTIKDDNDNVIFSFPEKILAAIKENIIHFATTIGSCFIVLALLENDNTKDEVTDILRPSLSVIKKSKQVGSKIIVKKLT